MPATCVAINCSEERSKDTAKRGITFHSFPKDPLRRKLWKAAVRRRTPDKKLWEPGKNSFLCSKHFKPETFDRTGQTVRLRDHAVPTEFNFTAKREVYRDY
ncbi:THAP2 protein, partial [Polyodon spathula]|nr:THAP2 protein [Polyodon spathula]